MTNFYTNPKYVEQGVLVSYSYSECRYWGSFSEYAEYYGSRFSPHPEENRLSFFRNSQPYGSDYYRVGLQKQDEFMDAVEDYYVTGYLNYWDKVLDENKGCTDITNLGADFYVNAVWGVVETSLKIWEKIQELIKDSTDYTEELIEFFGDDLVGYKFNRFSDQDWLLGEGNEEYWCTDKGLKVLGEFIEKSIQQICISQKERVVCDYADDLVEFFMFCYINSTEFRTLFLGEELLEQAVAELTSALWWGNPYVHMIGLFEHSGMCLEWGGRQCRWDSTSNAALIIGGYETAQSIFDVADNFVRGNVFDVEVYQVIKEADLKYFDDTEIIKVDKDIAKKFGVDDTELNVISLSSSGGYVFDDYDESGALDDLDFDLIEPRPYSVEMVEKYEAMVGSVPEQQIDKGKLPLGISVDVYVDRTKITGNSETEINDFIKTIVWKEVNEK